MKLQKFDVSRDENHVMHIGNTIEVTFKDNSKFYKLTDISIWQVTRLIKSANFKLINKIKEPDFRLKNDEPFIVESSYADEDAYYMLKIQTDWKDNDKIGGVVFRKSISNGASQS